MRYGKVYHNLPQGKYVPDPHHEDICESEEVAPHVLDPYTKWR